MSQRPTRAKLVSVNISERQFLTPTDQVCELRHNRAAVNWLYYGAKLVALDSLEAQEERQ